MADHGVVCSMSRWATFGTTRRWRASSPRSRPNEQRELYRTRDEARADVFDYIERFYNPKRRHFTIGYMSPMEFERQADWLGECERNRVQARVPETVSGPPNWKTMALDWFEQDNFERTAKEPLIIALKDRGLDFYKAGPGCANHLAGGNNASRGPTNSGRYTRP